MQNGDLKGKNTGSNMSVHVLLNLLNKLRRQATASLAFYLFFALKTPVIFGQIVE